MAKIRKRKDRDRWEVDYVGSDGKRRRQLVDSKEEAEDLLAVKIKESRQPAPEADPNVLLKDYASEWLKGLEADGTLAATTIRDYRHHLTAHVLPSIGHFKVRAITPGVVRTFERKKRETYAKNTVRLMRAALSVVLADAVIDGLLPSNPTLAAGGRRKRHGAMVKADQVESISPMSYEQREAFLAAARKFDATYHAVFSVSFKIGARPGEVLALKLDDLDLDRGTLRIERAVSLGEVKRTKTSEIRDVQLSKDLIAVLRDYVQTLRARALKKGWGEPDWLFPSSTNTPLDQHNVAKVWRRIRQRAKLPTFRWYDARHTYASLLLSRGVPLSFVSAQLGHRRPTVTLQFYSRWIPSEGSQYADVIDQAPDLTNPTKNLEPDLEPNAVSKTSNRVKSS